MSQNYSRFVLLVGGKGYSRNHSLRDYLALREEILSSTVVRNRLSSIYYFTEEGKVILCENQNLPDTEDDFMINGRSIDWIEMIDRIKKSKDYLFSMLRGKEGGDGRYQGLCQILELTGNLGSVFSACICRSKWPLSFMAPQLSQYLVTTPDTWLLSSRCSDQEMNSVIQQLSGRPAIIKPNSLGYSTYIEYSDSLTLSQLKLRIEIIKPHDNEILVQEFISGIEYTCGVLKINGKIQALPVAEVQTKNNFFGPKEKENNLEKIVFKEDGTEPVERIKLASLKLSKAIGIRNSCRFDFIYSNEKLYFLEANSIPGLEKDSIYPKMLKQANLSVLDFLNICISNQS